jgi:hypothetical protein
MTAAVALASDLPLYRILDPHVHVWKHQAQFPFAPGAKVPDYDATPEMLVARQELDAQQDGRTGWAVFELSCRSSIVDFERELDFALVILTIAYRSDFSEVSRVEEIE